MQNYGSTAPSEMSTITLLEKISEKSKLGMRKQENQSQIARTFDKVCLAYNSGEYNDAESFALSLNALRNEKIVDTSLQIYRLELQKKFVIPSACFFFALLAFPLGLGSRKAGRSAGFGLALLACLCVLAIVVYCSDIGVPTRCKSCAGNVDALILRCC